jgi:50S ribosomal protein L16 3-hydroxylase
MPKRQSAISSKSHSRRKGKQHPILGACDPETFLSGIWQQESLLIPSAFPGAASLVTHKDLLRLACRNDVDSRLVIADRHEKHWQGTEGSFRRADFATLPTSHWTLLVQAVDHWMPAVAGLLEEFSFLPRWRLDDIMVSLASQGGGVGPHFDYYDVFLLQASGRRRWQLGQQCDESTPLRNQVDLKLLKTFKKSNDLVLEPGDMLYVPAGLAHWGTALTDGCITISIGFRAASHRELLQIAQNHLASLLPDDARYRDIRPSIDSDHFCINEFAAGIASQAWQQLKRCDIDRALARALGEYATELRHPDHIVGETNLTLTRLKRMLARKQPLPIAHQAASRFAYHRLNRQDAELYVDGETHLTSLLFARAVCHQKITHTLLIHPREQRLFVDLIHQGSLVLEP